MAKQVDILADWATGASAVVTKPVSTKRAAGWTGGTTPDVPPAPYINWLHRTAYENVDYLIDKVYYSDTASWDSVPFPGTAFDSVIGTTAWSLRLAHSAFSFMDAQYPFRYRVAYNGGNKLMTWTAETIASPTAATGYMYFSGDKGRSFVRKAALSAFYPASITYDATNTRWVVAGHGLSAFSTAGYVQYSADDGATWTPVAIAAGVSDTWGSLVYWPQDGRYHLMRGNSAASYISASGSISSAWSTRSLNTSDRLKGSFAVGQTYIMAMGEDSGEANQKLYYSAPAAGGWSILTLNSGILNVPYIGSYATVHYLANLNAFIFVSTNGSSAQWAMLDGATGNPGTVGNWVSITSGTNVGGVPRDIWYDSTRQLYYYVGYTAPAVSNTGMHVSSSIAGPWRKITSLTGTFPALATSAKMVGPTVPVSKYDEWHLRLSDDFTSGNPTHLAGPSSATAAEAFLSTRLFRSFPVLF